MIILNFKYFPTFNTVNQWIIEKYWLIDLVCTTHRGDLEVGYAISVLSWRVDYETNHERDSAADLARFNGATRSTKAICDAADASEEADAAEEQSPSKGDFPICLHSFCVTRHFYKRQKNNDVISGTYGPADGLQRPQLPRHLPFWYCSLYFHFQSQNTR